LNRAANQEARRSPRAILRGMGMAWCALGRSFPLKALVCVCLGAGIAQPALAASSLIHKPAPEFVRTDLQGKRLDLSAYRGQVVLLNFWATWCAPCQLEMPRFVAWESQYGPRGLRIIGISMDDDPALARRMATKLKLNYPVAMGDEELGELYGGVLGLPLTFLIDSQGNVQAKFLGETNLNTIEEKFKPLLRP
jgi:cytochrome c biogenesis protein CcmG/thiol:disulfide interchange protein DsbE